MKFKSKIKSFIATVLSLTLAVSFLNLNPTVVSAVEKTYTYDEALEAYNFLKAVGAFEYDEKTFSGDAPVTRAYFVKLALCISGDAPYVLSSEGNVFRDVTSATEYESYIETACRIGYISGSPDGLFEPESTITFVQAVKILCNILGYDRIAEVNGGYPGGYLIVAQKMKLLTGLDLDFGDSLNMANVMLLLKNAIECDLMQIVSIGEETELEAVEGKNLLSERHGVKSVEGIITSNAYSGIYTQDSGLDEECIMIDSVIYRASYEIQEYIGCHVKLWYKADSAHAQKRALYATLTEQTTVLTVDINDVIYNDGEIKYHTETNEKKIKLDDFAVTFMNGKMTIMDYSELNDLSKGEISFISNDGNALIDIIQINRYDTFVAEGVSAYSNCITTRDGVRIELDPESDEYTFEIYKNSYPVSVDTIKSGDVILVCEGSGRGRVHKKLLASDETFTSKFDEIGDDFAIVNGKKYSLNGVTLSELEIGRYYDVKLDSFGNISYIDGRKNYVYGYLYGIAQIGLGEPMCKIFTENERWVELAFAKRVELDGRMMSGTEAFETLMSEQDFRQLVRYKVNSAAEVTMIQTALNIPLGSGDENGDGINEEELAIANDIFRLSYNGTLSFRATPKSFDGFFALDSAVKIFIVPSDLDINGFKIKSISSLSNNASCKITAYDVDEYLNCKVAVMDNTISKSVTNEDKFMLVTSIGQILNSNGDVAVSIKGWWEGEEMSFPVDTDENEVTGVANNLKKGDIICFKYNDSGDIIFIQPYPTDEKYYISGSLYASDTIIMGEAIKCDFTNKRLKLSYQEGKECVVSYNASTPVYVWETSTETFRKSDVTEFLKGDKVVANMRWLVCSEIVIVR